MTWEEFKKRVEAAGVHPTDEIDYIDVSDTSLDSHEDRLSVPDVRVVVYDNRREFSVE